MSASKFTNALIHEYSPYLLQHAHNPVAWMPWSQEVLAVATTQNKPVLLSIGYAACHWCHVMERESFEDAEVAAYMNAHFINIKVDREERPDIDQVYMDALQAMTGSGGWPLNIFLLPNGKPFYGGTYFPPKALPQRASWMDVLKGVKEAYENQYEKLVEQAENLTAHIVQTNIQKKSQALLMEPEAYPNLEEFDMMVKRILQQADTSWGGFGAAPKFPQTFAIQLLLRNFHSNKDQIALSHAIKSLDKMIMGGIYDHLGGGFSRYSTDAHWQAPHFEKMLYDNALLTTVISEAYQITKKPAYQKVIEEMVAFVERELKQFGGGYYAALDADSEGVEGKYYTWTYEEIKKVLPADLLNIFCSYYQIKQEGNWEHTNIIWSIEEDIEFAWSDKLVEAKRLLHKHRALRVRPGLDYKIILSWNALMITALCNASAALKNSRYKEEAVEAIQWVEENMYNKEKNFFYHTSIKGHCKTPAFLEDYASLIQSYIHLNKITGEKTYLLKAQTWMDYIQANFIDEQGVFFYFTNKEQQDIMLRKKDQYDGAVPSSNAMVCSSLLYLSIVFNRPKWKEQAMQMLGSMHKMLIQYPSSFAYWGLSFYQLAKGFQELVAIGPNVHENLLEANQPFLPYTILLFLDKSYPNFPLSSGKQTTDNQYFICKEGTCLAPASTIEAILAII